MEQKVLLGKAKNYSENLPSNIPEPGVSKAA